MSTEDPVQHARRVTKSQVAGMGCLLQLIGLILLFFFPIGTIIGLALLILGHFSARKLICGNCGNPLASRSVKLCPACHAHFQ
jgi:hypothetical protein